MPRCLTFLAFLPRLSISRISVSGSQTVAVKKKKEAGIILSLSNNRRTGQSHNFLP